MLLYPKGIQHCPLEVLLYPKETQRYHREILLNNPRAALQRPSVLRPMIITIWMVLSYPLTMLSDTWKIVI
jgi:hypothetical protein